MDGKINRNRNSLRREYDDFLFIDWKNDWNKEQQNWGTTTFDSEGQIFLKSDLSDSVLKILSRNGTHISIREDNRETGADTPVVMDILSAELQMYAMSTASRLYQTRKKAKSVCLL